MLQMNSHWQAAIMISIAISIAMQRSNNPRRKHIDVKHHLLRGQSLGGLIKLAWVPTAEQAADI